MAERISAQRLTVTLTGAAVFAALAAIITLARVELTFPVITYLKIDLTEIPIMIAFFLFGPQAGVIAAVVQWIFLNFTGSDAPLGPAIKFVAVISTLGGFWFGNSVYRRMRGNNAHPALAGSIMLSSGILWRVVAMTIVNIVVLLYVAPVFFGQDYLGYAKSTLESSGLQLGSETLILAYTLLFTALFNVVMALISGIFARLIVSPITKPFKHITSTETWLARTTHS